MNPLDPYNPEDYDDDQIETDDGWRCLVMAETQDGVEMPSDLQYYDDEYSKWKRSHCASQEWEKSFGGITYRTCADLPVVKAAPPAVVLPPDDPLAIILKMVKT